MKHTEKTLEKVAFYQAQGYAIIEGNNHRLPTRKKYRDYEIVRIARTNSRYHGHCINTIWAVKPVTV